MGQLALALLALCIAGLIAWVVLAERADDRRASRGARFGKPKDALPHRTTNKNRRVLGPDQIGKDPRVGG